MAPQLVPSTSSISNSTNSSSDAISSTQDAASLFGLARNGFIRIIRQHLTAEEKSAINAGHVYIYDANKIERWTDNRLWSKAYSTKAGWLIYKEVEYTPNNNDNNNTSPGRSKHRKADGLCKKILSDSVPGSSLRLVYYTDRLNADSDDSNITSISSSSSSRGSNNGANNNNNNNNGTNNFGGSFRGGDDNGNNNNNNPFSGPTSSSSSSSSSAHQFGSLNRSNSTISAASSSSSMSSVESSPTVSRANSLEPNTAAFRDIMEMRRQIIQQTLLQKPSTTSLFTSNSSTNFGPITTIPTTTFSSASSSASNSAPSSGFNSNSTSTTSFGGLDDAYLVHRSFTRNIDGGSTINEEYEYDSSVPDITPSYLQQQQQRQVQPQQQQQQQQQFQQLQLQQQQQLQQQLQLQLQQQLQQQLNQISQEQQQPTFQHNPSIFLNEQLEVDSSYFETNFNPLNFNFPNNFDEELKKRTEALFFDSSNHFFS